MNFKAFFKGQSGKGSAIQLKGRKLAPKEVQGIRDAYPHRRNIEDRINRDVAGLYTSVSLVLTEEQAKEIPAYAEAQTGNLQITVPDGFLNKFAAKEARKNDKGEYDLTFVCDEVKLFEAWKAEGYPTEWGIEAPKNTITEVPFIGKNQ